MIRLAQLSTFFAERVEETSQVLVLEPGRIDKNYLAELWSYRELLAVLAWRDLSIRYKQTAIGAAWAILRPFLTLLVLTIVFSRMAKLPSDGDAPYIVMVYAGMLPWFLMSTILSDASLSLVQNENLIGKVYFPKVILPFAATAVSVVDFLISFLLLLTLMLFLGFPPDWRICFLPLFILLAVGTVMGLALLLAALNLKYRDFRFIIPFVLQIGLYASPVGYSSALVAEDWRYLYSLNPAVGVIDGFRWCILGGQASLYFPALFNAIVFTMAFFFLGINYFRNTERTFADIL